MPGKPGMKGENLGGPRKGAGRPVKRMSLKAGDSFFVSTVTPEGPVYPSEVWEVTEVSRSVIVLKSNAGDTIKMIR
jgi:hypothetical protein